MVYWIPAAAVTNYHRFSGLKPQIYSLVVLETKSPKSGCWQDEASSKALRRILPSLAAPVSPGCPWVVVA